MKGNMGILDRIIRVALVAVVAVLYFTGQLSLVASIILGALAVIFLLTSIIGVCPLYLSFGLSTKRKPSTED
jgi:Protein of unknown function (DUF2892)